jgi:hypothetical protein
LLSQNRAKHAKILIMENIKSSTNQTGHQKQILWQVWIPLIAGILIVMVLAVLVVLTGVGGGEENGRLAGISLILMLIPTLVVCLLITIILGLLIFGVYKLTVILPVYSFKAFMYVVLASDYIKIWADRIVQPILIIREGFASLYRILDMFSIQPKK